MFTDPSFPRPKSTVESADERDARIRNDVLQVLGLDASSGAQAIVARYEELEGEHDEGEREGTAWGPAEQGEFAQRFTDPEGTRRLIDRLRAEAGNAGQEDAGAVDPETMRELARTLNVPDANDEEAVLGRFEEMETAHNANARDRKAWQAEDSDVYQQFSDPGKVARAVRVLRAKYGLKEAA